MKLNELGVQKFKKVVFLAVDEACKATLPFFTFTYSLTDRVVGAPQMTSQPVSSIFVWSPLPSGTWRSPGLSIP